ncbi:MAG: hypothetical protein K8T10_22195 [Candidatus Eremiobacteraeota bacterium]|nr:hypothetical protein [Candidatus Eremiobacteraeota bacterium]
MHGNTSQLNSTTTVNKTRIAINDLIDILQKENKCALEMNGEALEELREAKSKSVKNINKLMLSPTLRKHDLSGELSRLHQLNVTNLKLFRFMIKMADGYRKILSGTGLCCGTYNKKGYFEQRRVSIKFNRSA